MHVYLYMLACLHTYTHTYTHVHTYVHIYMAYIPYAAYMPYMPYVPCIPYIRYTPHVFIYVINATHMCKPANKHAYMHTCIPAYMHTCIHTHQFAHAYLYAIIHARRHNSMYTDIGGCYFTPVHSLCRRLETCTCTFYCCFIATLTEP